MVAALAVLVAGGCGTATQLGPDSGGAYVAVIDWYLTVDGEEFGASCQDSVVFIESIGPDEIPFDTQVAIVNHYEERPDIRFVDAREEALDAGVVGQPVRDGCVLLGLGPLVDDPETHEPEVRGEMYRDADHVTAHRFQLVLVDESWSIVGEPLDVDVEGLAVEQ